MTNKCEDRYRQKFNEKDFDTYAELTLSISETDFVKSLLPSNTFEDSIYLEFCNELFKAPYNYEEVLVQMFGDYLQLPKKENRKPHHRIISVLEETKEERGI